jgi:hypothetical protein
MRTIVDQKSFILRLNFGLLELRYLENQEVNTQKKWSCVYNSQIARLVFFFVRD